MATLNQPNNRKQQLAALFRRRIPEKPVEFAPGELSTKPEQVFIYFPGAWLDVQPGYCALVKFPNGTIVNLRAGSHYLNGSAAPYTIQFYDLSRQMSVLQEIGSDTADAWMVTFNKFEVQWKIDDPREIMSIPLPRNVLESLCRKMLIDYIRKMRYDQLVSVPGQTPISTAEIADTVMSALRASNSLKGFQITEVLIMGVRGDQRRADHEMRTQHEQARLTAARLLWEQNYLQQSQANAIKEAETKRLVAVEGELVRLPRAEITANEARILRDAQIQAVQLQQFAEQQRMQHEQMMKAIEVQGDAFGKIASALLQASTFNGGGIQRGMDGGNLEGVARAMEVFASRMPSVSFAPSSTLPILESQKPISLRDRIVEELHQVQKLPGTEGTGVKETKPGFVQAEILHLNIRIFVVCDEHYPISAPIQIEARKNGDINYKSVAIEWSEGMSMAHVVQQVATKFHSNTFMEKIHGKGNGSKEPKSLAA